MCENNIASVRILTWTCHSSQVTVDKTESVFSCLSLDTLPRGFPSSYRHLYTQLEKVYSSTLIPSKKESRNHHVRLDAVEDCALLIREGVLLGFNLLGVIRKCLDALWDAVPLQALQDICQLD